MTYSSRPERKGYRLTYDGEQLYQNWLDLGGCICFTGCAPCHSCVNEGHPISLEETDEVWEPEFTEYVVSYEDFGCVGCPAGQNVASAYCVTTCPHLEGYDELLNHTIEIYCRLIEETEGGNDEMSRSDVINVKEPTKSPWFGYKYRVTPETSKLLQEAVFKDGGGWQYSTKTEVRLTDSIYVFVDSDGGLSHQGNDYIYFDKHPLPEKVPPQPETKKEFKKNYWYKCISGTYGDGGVTRDKHYLVTNVGGRLTVAGDNGVSNLFGLDRFDVNSESYLQPMDNPCSMDKVESIKVDRDSKIEVRFEGKVRAVEVQLTINQQEENIMSNVARRIVNIEVVDQDSALDVEDSVVVVKEKVVTQDSDEVTIREWLSTGELKEALEAHNKKRTDKVNRDILNRTGNKVYLEVIKVKDLTIRVV